MIKIKDKLLALIVKIISISVLISIFFIYIHIFLKAKPILNFGFLIAKPSSDLSKDSGGIFPALVGTLYLGLLAGALAGIFSLSLAIYTVFYKNNKLLDFTVFLLSGIPSIIYGLFYYSFLIYGLRLSRGLFISSITIATMILPFIVIRVKKILLYYKENFYLQALSLGLSREYTIINIILKLASTEIVMSVILAMSYGIGAVAPIIYTGAVISAGVPKSINAPFMSLAYHLYILVNNGFSLNYAYGSAFVLISMIILIHIISKICIGLSRRGNDRN